MRALLVLALAGCNTLFGIPGSGELIGDDAPSPDGPLPPGTTCQDQPTACALLASNREVGFAGQLLVLEGAFGDSVEVAFPGGAMATATTVGPRRALVEIPNQAQTGTLSITTAGTTVDSAVRFRGVRSQLGIAHFQTHYHQTESARQHPRLTVTRGFAQAVAIKDRVFVMGGSQSTAAGSALSSIDIARINADGTLTSFNKFVASSLTVPRSRFAALAVGEFVYALGGETGESAGTVDRASIGPDGLIAPFAADSHTLVQGRAGAAAVVIGDGLYVVGGFDGDGVALATIERAPLGTDGAIIGPFVTAGMLSSPRGAHTVAVVEDRLFVLGGADSLGGNALATIDSGPIDQDGALGTFTPNGVTMSETRAAPSSLLLGNDIWVFGGANSTGTLSTIEVLSVAGSVVSRVNPNRSLSVKRAGAAAVVVDDNVHLIGGFEAGVFKDDDDMASLVETGDLAAPSGAAPLTPSRIGYGAAVIRDGLFLFGGEQTGAAVNSVARAQLSPNGFIDGEFTDVPAGFRLMAARHSPAIAVTQNLVHVLGGASTAALNSAETARVLANGLLEDFNAAAFTMQNVRASASAAFLGTKLYVFGGEGGGASLNSVLVGDAAQDGSAGNLDQPAGVSFNGTAGRRGHCSAVIRNQIYLIGGGGQTSNVPQATIDRCQFDATGTITQCIAVSSVLTSARRDVRCAVVGNTLWVIGSDTNTGRIVERISFDPNTGALVGNFTTVGTGMLGDGRQRHVLTRLGTQVFVVGGQTATGSSPVNSSERLEQQ